MSSDNPISIPLGIIIGLLSSCVQSLGLTIQRKSHVLNQSLPEHLQRVEHRRPLWLLGFAVFISSNILGSFVQIASLPVVILAPLGAVSLLWNAFFARFLLGDVFSPWMVLGTIFITGGAILIGIFGIVPEQTHSLEDLLELFRRPTFIVYFSMLGFVLIISLMITHAMEFSLARRISHICPSNPSSIDLSTTTVTFPSHFSHVTTGLTDDINHTLLPDEQTPLIDRKSGTVTLSGGKQMSDPAISTHHTRLVLAISYASFSGMISGMCLLFAKSGVELLLVTLRGKNQFRHWEAWCLVLGLVAFALLQLLYLHKALVLADPTIVCPSAFCFYNLSSIANGLVYFDQFSLIPPSHLVLVSTGIVILLGGVWVVSIQSGGGGVDLGTWDEEIIDFNSADLEGVLETDDAISAADAMPLLEQQAIGSVPVEGETTSESSMRVDKPGFGKMKTPVSCPPDGRKRPRRAQTLYTSPRLPSIHTAGKSIIQEHARVASSPLESHPFNHVDSRPMHQATSSFHLSHPHAHALTHGSLSSSLAPALQIGLSPVSPGFAILPLERKKTIAGGDGIGSGNGAPRGRYWKMRRRRTVSDGEVSRRNYDLVGSQAQQKDQHVIEVVDREDCIEEPEIEPGPSVRGLRQENLPSIVQQMEHRWRWFTDFLPRGLHRKWNPSDTDSL